MDKVASPFLPEIRTYIDGLKPNPNSIYALVNALGAYEYWSSNINGDAFEEEFLIHRGPVYGYETFKVYAKPFMHHANKDPARAFGEVELAAYNTNMHRVELVVRIDRDRAEAVGAQRVVDKIDQGMLPDTAWARRSPKICAQSRPTGNSTARLSATTDPTSTSTQVSPSSSSTRRSNRSLVSRSRATTTATSSSTG